MTNRRVQRPVRPRRGEIWLVSLDPTTGVEIRKTRPCLVVSANGMGGTGLRTVVPLTGRKDKHARYPWCVVIAPDGKNGLDKQSAADAAQIRAVSVERCVRKLGIVSPDDILSVEAAMALSLGLRIVLD